MPYITKDRRKFEYRLYTDTPGEVNYAITCLINNYIKHKGGISYTNVNEAIGILECAKLELYRRIAAPYEDVKIEENGDVYYV